MPALRNDCPVASSFPSAEESGPRARRRTKSQGTPAKNDRAFPAVQPRSVPVRRSLRTCVRSAPPLLDQGRCPARTGLLSPASFPRSTGENVAPRLTLPVEFHRNLLSIRACRDLHAATATLYVRPGVIGRRLQTLQSHPRDEFRAVA